MRGPAAWGDSNLRQSLRALRASVLIDQARRFLGHASQRQHAVSCLQKRKVAGNILRDDEITLKTKKSKGHYPKRMRRIVALVKVDGKSVQMVFITNNMDWATSSVCDLYQARWALEVFFKQIKQTLQICDFLGHSKQAIRWQPWTALLLYILLRFQAWNSRWPHSFARLFTMIRSVV
jgi:hypothetical protein